MFPYVHASTMFIDLAERQPDLRCQSVELSILSIEIDNITKVIPPAGANVTPVIVAWPEHGTAGKLVLGVIFVVYGLIIGDLELFRSIINMFTASPEI